MPVNPDADKPTVPQRYLTMAPKTTAAGTSGALTVILFYALRTIWDIDPPAEVAAAISVLVATVCAWLAPLIPARRVTTTQ